MSTEDPQTPMRPLPPFLAIRRGMAFWVEDWTDGHSSSTWQALRHGCYKDLVLYDTAGVVWPVLRATPVSGPGLLDRLLPWRRIKVALVLGDGVPTPLRDVVERVRTILETDRDFEWQRGPTPPELAAQFNAATSAREVIETARMIEPTTPRRAARRT